MKVYLVILGEKLSFLENNLVLKQFGASRFIFPTYYTHIDSKIMISLIMLLNGYIEEGSWA